MAENTNAQERTEQATPRRRQKAREEGNVPRSVEVASVVVLVAGLIALAAIGGGMANRAGSLMRLQLSGIGSILVDVGTITDLATEWVGIGAAILMPFAAVVAVAALGAHMSQVGVLISLKALQPKFSRISPATGLKRIFSKRGLVEFAKSLLKLTIVGAIMIWALLASTETLFPLMSVGLAAGYLSILMMCFKMAAAGAFALALVAVLDFFFQRWDYEQQLKMTRQEVKEEQKQSEGDPQIKTKVRARQQELSRRRMMEDVRTADVVVTNPVRFAVALKYDPADMAAPTVVAKGARLLAKRIRDIAREAGVPIVEDPPLARALYQICKVGGQIPLSLYKAVAELLAFVYRNRSTPVGGGVR